MFLLPLGECSFFLRFLPLTDTSVLTEWIVNFFNPASAATDMDIDKVPDDEETDDAATSKASKSARLEFIRSIGLFVSGISNFFCLLQLHETLSCFQTMKKKCL